MNVRVTIRQQGVTIDEVFRGETAEEVVRAVKSRIARELPFAMRLAVGAMGSHAFAQEVVKRYNAAERKNLPIPNTCDEFLRLAQDEGFATILD